MKMNVFVRHRSPGSPAPLDDVSPDRSITTYDNDLPFPDLAAKLHALDAPLVVFADAEAAPSRAHLRKAERVLERNTALAGVTFECGLLDTFEARSGTAPRGNAVAQRMRPIQAVPPWFVVLRREVLDASGFFQSDFLTLDFALVDVSRWLVQRDAFIGVLETPALVIDPVEWCATSNAHALAQDYTRDRSRTDRDGRSSSLPAQLQVEIVGETKRINTAPQESNLNDPTFSILCPAFKSDYFEEMLQSVAMQTWATWELLIAIDGPPTEHEESILRALDAHKDDKRIRFFTQENQGTGPTRKRLSEMATGDFIFCIDDDDKLPPYTLARFAAALQQFPEAEVLRGGTRLFGRVDSYIHPRPRVIIGGMSADLFEVNQPFAFRRGLLDQLGGFEGDPDFAGAGEDSDFFLRLDRARARTIILDEPLYLRRISGVNQALQFTGDQFNRHVRNLIDRHKPEALELGEVHFRQEGPALLQVAEYTNRETGRSLLCSTKYVNYHVLSSLDDVKIDLEITSLCNADCTFCPRDAMRRTEKFMSLALVQRLAAELAGEAVARRVILCGIGEPLLHPEAEEIVRILTAAGAYVCMTSNGTGLMLDRYKRLVALGLKQLNVSVNAVEPETYETVMKMPHLRKVEENLRAVLEWSREARPLSDVNVSFVLCRDNDAEAHRFIARWRDSGVAKIMIHPVNNRANLLSDQEGHFDPAEYTRRYADDPLVEVDIFRGLEGDHTVCKITQSMDFITVDGDVLLCSLDFANQHVLGNIADTPLRTIHDRSIAHYAKGHFASFCTGCTFCPSVHTRASGSAEPAMPS